MAPTPKGVTGFATHGELSHCHSCFKIPLYGILWDSLGVQEGTLGNGEPCGRVEAAFRSSSFFPVAEVKAILNGHRVSQGPATCVPALTHLWPPAAAFTVRGEAGYHLPGLTR